MSIIKRFGDIIASNINDLLDKCEDPSKMIDQYLRNLSSDLAEVKKETAGVMAEESRCRRNLEAALDEVEKYEGLAEKAVLAGNDDDARVFLEREAKAEANVPAAQATYDVARNNADKMRQLHDKLVNDIGVLRSKQNTIKATIAVAETQKRVNKMGGLNSQNNLGKFQKMEERAQGMLDTATAEAILNAEPVDEADALASKYAGGKVTDTDAALAAIKERLSLLPKE